MRDHFPPNFWLTGIAAVATLATACPLPIMGVFGNDSVPVLGGVCCGAAGVVWMWGWIAWGVYGLAVTETHLVQYRWRPDRVIRRIRLSRVASLARTPRATYVTTASGAQFVVAYQWVRRYADLYPALRAAVGPDVPATDTSGG